MTNIPGLERIEGRISSIEARIEALSMEFKNLSGVSEVNFQGALNHARKNSLAPYPFLQPNAGLQAMDNSILQAGKLENLLLSVDDKNESDAFGKLVLEGSRGVGGSSIGTKNRLMLDAYRRIQSQADRGSGIGGFDVISEIARRNPSEIIKFEGFSMQAETAVKYTELKELIKQEFPGRGIHITSTMDGKHVSPAHPEGRAIDFVVDNLTIEESKRVEELARDAGFRVFNEYIHDSRYKTGPHIHIEL
jgi:hypothetical protein